MKYIYNVLYIDFSMSHPTRVRGLKFDFLGLENDVSNVAPHEGAWIEMWNVMEYRVSKWSHPTRVRGLKYDEAVTDRHRNACRTPRGCVD